MKPDEIFSVGTLKAAGRSNFYLLNFAHFFNQESGKAKGVITAIFLSHFIYWEGKQEDEPEPGSEWSGWIYKSLPDINRETGLGRYGIEFARDQLITMGLMQEKRAKVPARLFYRFNWTALEKKFTAWYRSHDDTPVDAKKKKKPEFPEEPKGPSEAKLLQDSMVKSFDSSYMGWLKSLPNAIPEPIGYAWSGKDFKHLKEIQDKFKSRIVAKNDKNKENGLPLIEINSDAILNSWIHFLGKLTAYHKKSWFSPPLLNSNFNNIIRDLQSGTTSASNKNESSAKSNDGTEYLSTTP